MLLKQIDERIINALLLLEKLQQTPKGFEAWQTYRDIEGNYKWSKAMKNACLSAHTLLPLITLKNNMIVRKILTEEMNRLYENKTHWKMWHYFTDKSAPFFVPFDTDTNALLNYLSIHLGDKPLSKKYFYYQLRKDGLFNLWFAPTYSTLLSNPMLYISIKKVYKKALGKISFIYNVVNKDDAEICGSANVLLYLGESKHTQKAIERIVDDIQSDNLIELIYYPSQIVVLYLLSRAFFYGKIKALGKIKGEIEQRIKDLYADEVIRGNKLYSILVANILLIFNSSGVFFQKTIKESWQLFDEINEPFPFYCTNKNVKFNPLINNYHVSFGSPALTISVYVEFLNLYRKRFYGGYYEG